MDGRGGGASDQRSNSGCKPKHTAREQPGRGSPSSHNESLASHIPRARCSQLTRLARGQMERSVIIRKIISSKDLQPRPFTTNYTLSHTVPEAVRTERVRPPQGTSMLRVISSSYDTLFLQVTLRIKLHLKTFLLLGRLAGSVSGACDS